MKLTACPYCGQDKPKLLLTQQDFKDEYYVLCKECEAHGPTNETEEEAIEEWNGVANAREAFRKHCNEEVE